MAGGERRQRETGDEEKRQINLNILVYRMRTLLSFKKSFENLT